MNTPTLLTEIDRQAANVGLGEASQGTGATGSIPRSSVYIGGGGDAQSNAKVSVDLSSASDRVSQNSLGLVGSNISGGVLSGDVGNVKNISTGAILAANADAGFHGVYRQRQR